jgi:prolyl oligopeptidase
MVEARKTQHISPPSVETPRIEVVELLHGHRIADPYRWLEDSGSEATRSWTQAQNARTQAVLDAVPGRGKLEEELGDLLRVGAVSDARHVNGRFFFTRRLGDQDQPVLYVRVGIDGEDRVLIDPAALGERGLISLDWWQPSHDGALVAAGLSEGGDEWSVLHVIDAMTGERVGETIPRARASSVAWLPDNSGFYYTRYPMPGAVPAGDESYYRRVYFHEIGTNIESDPLVFGEDLRKEDLPSVTIDPAGRWVVVSVDEGWIRSWIHVLDRENPDAGFCDITPEGSAVHQVIGVDGGVLYNLTTWQAPNSQVIAYPLEAQGVGGWSTVIPERDDRVIEHAALTNGGIVTGELEKAIGQLRRYGRDGEPQGELALPGIGTLINIQGSAKSDVVVAIYQSFVQPPTALVFMGNGEDPVNLSPIPTPSEFDPEECDIRQVWYSSRDGQKVSMFLVYRKGLKQDGSHPVYLTGYGGFNVTRGSEYMPPLPFWLQRGGILALPNLRGGAEYGSTWHEGGMLGNKQRTFDDFIAAAEYLIAERYTKPERLGIAGGSNGGLLVGAAITQRPDLFRAAISTVPLQDMLRYHLFRIARLWIPEYGSSEDPEQFAWLHAYSPYHAVREGAEYPAVLLTLGENDSRVDPMHARKMAAGLQHATASGDDRPILLRAEENAGHGQGKPLWMRVKETADLWGFMCWQLGVEV